jgi:nucleotide-binding universal stress UspA family protein
MHVLLAIDGSEESLQGASYLTRIPFAEPVTVTVVTALTDSSFDADTAAALAKMHPTEEERARQWFDAVRPGLEAAGFTVHSRIVPGVPHQVILDQAKELRVDLIALGARGHWAINRMVVGSTADYVANNAHCSVFLTRPVDSGALPVGTPSKVLVAYDGTPPSVQAYKEALSLAWPKESRVLVAMILEKPKLIPDDEDYDPVAIDQAKEQLAKMASQSAAKCEIVNSVSERIHVGNALLSKVENEHSDLVFIGGTNKSALARFFLGSVGRYLLHNCSCSMWIARGKTK